MQGNHFSLLQHETEKLRSDIEKMRSELRYVFLFSDNMYLQYHAHILSFSFELQSMLFGADMKLTKLLLVSVWI